MNKMKGRRNKKESIDHAFEQMLMSDMQMRVDICSSFEFHFDFKNKYFLTQYGCLIKKTPMIQYFRIILLNIFF
jgi:hypothetical protein